MMLSEFIKKLSKLLQDKGDLDVEAIEGNLDDVDAALSKNDPFPVKLLIKPPEIEPSAKRHS